MRSIESQYRSEAPIVRATDKRALVVVGFAEALAAPEVVWSLVDDGFEVAAFARKGRPSAIRHSRHVVCHEICPPEVNLERSLKDLRALLEKFEKSSGTCSRILFPLDDKAVWLIDALQATEDWIVAGPQDGLAELALNKELQFHAAREAGFNVPEYAVAKTADEVFRFAGEQDLPLILKPANVVPTRDGLLVKCPKWICADRPELERAVAAWSERTPLLVQRFITGTGEGIFGLVAGDDIRAWSGHRRLRMMNPQGSGSSACISECVSDEMKAKASTLVAAAGWRGLFMIELLRDSSGKVWFVELNGRPWGSMALARRQGLEYPAWNLRLFLDRDSSVAVDATGTTGIVCRHVGREFMHLLFVLKGAKSKAFSEWPSFGSTVRNLLSFHRSDTVYNWRSSDRNVFFADCFYTVHGNLFKARD